jgi:DNA gyrase subunit A
MQTSFGINMLAIVHNRPKVLSLVEMMQCFVEHRREVVTKRTLFELKKAEARAHILEGLKIALDWLDAVIELIRASKNPEEAKQGLMAGWFSDPVFLKKLEIAPLDQQTFRPGVQLSEKQAQAILEMRLQRLTGLERDKILQEYEDIMRLIARLKEILASDQEIMKIIVGELTEIKDKFGDKRRSEIIDRTAEISLEDTIEDAEMVVTVSHSGYIKRSAVDLYRAQRRGGKGKTGMKTKEEDFVEQLFIASTKDYLLFFTDMGRVYRIKVYEIPEGSRTTKGKAVVNLVNVQDGEKVTTILPVKDLNRDDLFLFMATKQGVVKKTPLMEYVNIRTTGINAVNLDEGDKLIAVALTDGSKDIFLASRCGKAIRFSEEDARPMGRVTRGVRGMNLENGDVVIGMEVVDPTATGSTIFTVTENGYGKRTDLDEYRGQSRGGKGLITIKTSERNGMVVDVMQVADDNELMVITDQGKILRVPVSGFSVIGRNTQGVRLMVTEDQEKIVAVAKLAESDEDDDEGSEEQE